jgi:ATP-binding cassette subfamily B protein
MAAARGSSARDERRRGRAGLRRVLDALAPPDLRSVLRMAGAGRDFALGALLAVLSAWGIVAAPWLIGKAVNELKRTSTEHLALVALAVAGAGLLTAVLSGAALWLLGRFAAAAGARIRDLLYDHLLVASLDLFRTQPTGQLVARATADVEPIKLLLTGGVSVFAQLAGTIGFAVVVMLLIDPELAGIALIPLPVAIAVQLLYGARTRAATVRAEERRGIVATEANDDVRAARLIFALGLEGRERAQFARAVAALFRGYLRLGRLDATYGSVLDFIPYVSLGLVLAFGSRAVVDGRISLGEFVTFFGFASILSVASNQVGYFTYLVASAAGSATRILELLHHPREPTDADDADTGGWGGLTLEGVSVAQQGTAAPLEDVDLDITPGETIAIVGATGAGKSTLLDVVDGLIEPERGEIATGGTHPAGVGLGGLRRLAALGGEGSGLFSMSIGDNIAYGRPGATAAEIEAAARRAHADSVVARLPDGYETQVGEEGGRLSGGERQRIALARALLVEPRILLLNNITSSLDPKAANEVLSSLADTAAGADRVLTTNDVATLTLADRIVVLEEGRVQCTGTHEELLETCPRYREMVALWEDQ